MRLFIIRHAQALSNIGMSDTPNSILSDLGQKQARALIDLFNDINIDVMYSSPFRRTIQTSKPLADFKGKTIYLVPQMSEHFNEDWIDYRDHDWESNEKVLSEFSNIKFIHNYNPNEQWWPVWPETNENVLKRAKEFYDLLIKEYLGTDKTIVVVGHWASASALQKAVNPKEDFKFANASVCEYNIDSTGKSDSVKLHLDHLNNQLTY